MSTAASESPDVVLIGAGIMSATLGTTALNFQDFCSYMSGFGGGRCGLVTMLSVIHSVS
jgi:hypothetical protein